MADIIAAMREMLDKLEAEQVAGIAEVAAKPVRCRPGRISCSPGRIKKAAGEEEILVE